MVVLAARQITRLYECFIFKIIYNNLIVIISYNNVFLHRRGFIVSLLTAHPIVFSVSCTLLGCCVQ